MIKRSEKNSPFTWAEGFEHMKLAICDDDKQELTHILSLLVSYQRQHTIDISIQTFQNSFELACAAPEERYDLYLLDIIMPGLNGMELAREIRNFDKAADIIFLTTSPEFAVESYTVKATNYLMKPVSEEKLFHTLDEILETKEKELEKSIVLKSNIGVHKILLSRLMYVEAQGRKVIYYLNNGEEIICTDRFTSVGEQLLQQKAFIQSHRSILVNMNFIRLIGTTDMQLQNGTVLPLAQRRVSEIKQHYLAFQMNEVI